MVQKKLLRYVFIALNLVILISYLQVVSKKIAGGDLKSLEGLVTQDLIPNIQNALSLMSLTQREQLAINVDDIYFCFPYQVSL